MTVRPADNPFASARIDTLEYRFLHGDLDELVNRVRHHNGRGAIVGPQGSGKTTLLEQLTGRIARHPVWIGLHSGLSDPGAATRAQLPEAVADDHAIFIDGAEQLSSWEWRRLCRRLRRAGTVLITSHTVGRLPTVHQCATDPKLLMELVIDLAPEAVDAVDLEALFYRREGNIRECFREMYDIWAGRRDP